MPTYAFTTARNLTAERERLRECITTIHQVEAKAPRSFVQTIFYKVEPGSIFIGDEAASPDHVWVRADIRAGRTNEQKKNILQRTMRETSAILGICEQDVWVYVSEIPAQGMLELGDVLPEPGGEEQWWPSARREKPGQAA